MMKKLLILLLFLLAVCMCVLAVMQSRDADGDPSLGNGAESVVLNDPVTEDAARENHVAKTETDTETESDAPSSDGVEPNGSLRVVSHQQDTDTNEKDTSTSGRNGPSALEATVGSAGVDTPESGAAARNAILDTLSELASPPPATEEKTAAVSAREVAEPEVVEPEVVEPEVVEPEVVEPEVTEPEVVKPEVVEPEVAEPEVAEPEVAEPEVTEPEVAEPGVVEPEGESTTTQPAPINPVGALADDLNKTPKGETDTAGKVLDSLQQLGMSMQPGRDSITIGKADLDGIAYKAGLRVGDTIISVNREPVFDTGGFDAVASEFKAGQPFKVFVVRGYEWRSFKVALPAEADETAETQSK